MTNTKQPPSRRLFCVLRRADTRTCGSGFLVEGVTCHSRANLPQGRANDGNADEAALDHTWHFFEAQSDWNVSSVEAQMEELLPAVTGLAVHLSPAVVATIWATLSRVPRVKKLMFLSAKLVILVVIAVFLFVFLSGVLCQGSALKGFVQCNSIPLPLANLSLPFYLLSMAVLALWCIAMVVICVGAEIDAMRERDKMR